MKVRREGNRDDGANRPWASRLYFKDILRFPRVILVMLANRNQQRTFERLEMIPA